MGKDLPKVIKWLLGRAKPRTRTSWLHYAHCVSLVSKNIRKGCALPSDTTGFSGNTPGVVQTADTSPNDPKRKLKELSGLKQPRDVNPVESGRPTPGDASAGRHHLAGASAAVSGVRCGNRPTGQPAGGQSAQSTASVQGCAPGQGVKALVLPARLPFYLK